MIECCDSPKNPVEMDVEEIKENNLQSVEHLESSGSDNTDIIDFEIEEPAPHPPTEHIEVKDAASMTDAYFHDFPSFNPFHRDLQEFFKYVFFIRNQKYLICCFNLFITNFLENLACTYSIFPASGSLVGTYLAFFFCF